MKIEDFRLMETCLQNAYDRIMEAYENCDTSANTEDVYKDVNEWNKDLDKVINKLQNLKNEMIFTFKIED